MSIAFMSSWWIVPLIIKKCLSLSLVSFLTLKSILFDINTATPAILWMPCTWNIIFLPFTLNLSLELRWSSCRQDIVESCFLIHPTTLCLLVLSSAHLYLGLLLIYEDLLQAFYLLFFGLSISIVPFPLWFCCFSLLVFYNIFFVSSFTFNVSALDFVFFGYS